MCQFLDQIVHGNCLEIIPLLPDASIDAIVTDPPYGESMGYEGDDGLPAAANLLLDFLRISEPKLKRNAHVVIFWTMRNLDRCIDCVREAKLMYRRTLSMYIPKGSARPYLGWLPRTQAIVVAQKYLPKQPSDFHYDLATYLSERLSASQLSRSEVARRLGCDSRLVMKWTRVGDPAWCLPTPRFYAPLKQLLDLDDRFDCLLDREITHHRPDRSDLQYRHDTYIVDNQLEERLHPSQKPLSVLEHIVSCVAPKGGLVVDGFMGSGTTAVACRNTGRYYFGAEISERFFKLAQQRLKNIGPAKDIFLFEEL